MDRHFQHALVLLDQGRFDLAEEKLRQALAAEPENGLAHAFLAHCLCERKGWNEAMEEARQAIHQEPELAEAHAALARVLHERNHLDEAVQAIGEALRLDPENPVHFQRLAGIHLLRRDWQEALRTAEMGLAIDPEHVGCTNLRAMSLVKLGRTDDARSAVATALARNPENAFSHANQGWNLLHAGNRTKALEHFREALRLDPTMDFARAGIVEALKSKNWFYALMLRYFLWMARLSTGVQWAVVLGGYFGYQVLREVSAKNPHLAPWIRPLLVAYVIFAVMTWIASPLFNLMLRLDRFGRHALSREQVAASNWIACLLFPALILAGIWLFTDNILVLLCAIFFGLLLLPVSAVYNCPAGWPRRAMAFYTLGLAAVGLLVIGFFLGDDEQTSVVFFQIFLWGGFLSGFVANFLVMQSPRL
jgi:tetratricopeptide (TPR) repeat protein